jgi:hypothetical protein
MAIPVVSGVFECPRCGAEFIAGEPAILAPPTCGFGHPSCEMEQKLERPEHGEELRQVAED